MSKFKKEYPKSHRPEITDLDQFLNKEISCFFREFSNVILDKYDLRFGFPHGRKKMVGCTGLENRECI